MAGACFVLVLMTVLNQPALTPFCDHENNFSVRSIQILMADHCGDVPAAALCKMNRLVSHSERSGGGTVLYYPANRNKGGRVANKDGELNQTEIKGFVPNASENQGELMSFIGGPSVQPACDCTARKIINLPGHNGLCYRGLIKPKNRKEHGCIRVNGEQGGW